MKPYLIMLLGLSLLIGSTGTSLAHEPGYRQYSPHHQSGARYHQAGHSGIVVDQNYQGRYYHPYYHYHYQHTHYYPYYYPYYYYPVFYRERPMACRGFIPGYGWVRGYYVRDRGCYVQYKNHAFFVIDYQWR